jgi:hypothetical protein
MTKFRKETSESDVDLKTEDVEKDKIDQIKEEFDQEFKNEKLDKKETNNMNDDKLDKLFEEFNCASII